jgi:hypothetical protein
VRADLPAESRHTIADADDCPDAPLTVDLNHASWEDISRDMLDWAENILKCYQDLLDVEKKSREVADARAKAEIEHRARLAAYAQGHSAR